ncbi:MAG: SH3 domain-containing protein, partial [Clostridium sp.]|nr:SH3 domain-containing protein [Clostridium sp.]
MKKRMMKMIAMFLTLLFMMAVPITAYADTACVVTGTKNYLALRTEPRTSSSNEIGKLYNGEMFYMTGSSNGFAYGYTAQGRYGYVNANYLQVVNYVQPVAPQPQYTPQPQ